MSVGQLCELIGHRRRLRGGGGQPCKDAGRIEASVEALAEFGQVTRQMLGTDRMVGAVDGVLDVAGHGIDPVEHLPMLGDARAVHVGSFPRVPRGLLAEELCISGFRG
jgi:hypothetical protein